MLFIITAVQWTLACVACFLCDIPLVSALLDVTRPETLGSRFPWLEPDRPPGPWWPPDCLSSSGNALIPPAHPPPPLGLWVIGDRALLTTIHYTHVSLNTTILGHRETSAVDERKSFTCSDSSCFSHRPGCHTVCLFSHQFDVAQLISLSQMTQLGSVIVSPLSRVAPSSVTQSRMCCVTICVTVWQCQQSTSQCLLLWINLRLATTTISSASKLTNNKLLRRRLKLCCIWLFSDTLTATVWFILSAGKQKTANCFKGNVSVHCTSHRDRKSKSNVQPDLDLSSNRDKNVHDILW